MKENNLTGLVSHLIGNLSELTVLNLSFNQLSGNIPEEIFNGDMDELTYLDLQNNFFQGWLTCDWGLHPGESLYINLSSNQLSGEIPLYCQMIDGPSDGAHFYLDNNNFCGPFPVSEDECYIYPGEQDSTNCTYPLGLGDLNQDYTVNVQDLIVLVDIVLFINNYDIEPTDFELSIGDIYADNQLNIVDIVGLVNMIINETWLTCESGPIFSYCQGSCIACCY